MVLSIGAAVVTGVIVIGVVAGPAAASCVQRGDFWACMNQTMFGSQPEAATAEAPTRPDSTASTETTEDGAAEPVATAQAPTFDIVRVEPDGSAVFAGSATPSGEVILFLNDDELGSEAVDPSGDWVFVTDAPLATGGVELRVFDVEAEQYADTAMIVVVQDDRAGEPLVIASTPGEASEILQGLDTAEPVSVAQLPQTETPDTQTVEAAEPQTPPEQPADEPTMTVAQSDEMPAAATSAQPTPASVNDDAAPDQAEIPATTEPTPAPDADVPAANDADTPAQAAAEAPALADAQPLRSDTEASPAVAESESTAEAELLTDKSADATETDGVTSPASEPETTPEPAEQEAAAAAQTPDAAPEATAVPASQSEPETDPQPQPEDDEVELRDAEQPSGATQPDDAVSQPSPQAVATASATIDAIEIDGDLNFFAGSGAEGSIVRLYVENRLIGSAVVADGRWLVEAINVLTEESQRVRIDMLAADGAVASRAEVDFVLDLPEQEAPIVVAEQPAVQDDSSSLPASSAPSAEVETAEPASNEAAPNTDQPGQNDATATDVATPASEASQPGPEVTQSVTTDAPLDTPASEDDDVPAIEEEPATVQPDPEPTEPDVVPTMVGVTEGSRTTSGLAIIRRGDNLWTIALRVYGEGIRYTQIFEANTDQIRNPDLIYPGQVFDLPGTDAVVGEGEAD